VALISKRFRFIKSEIRVLGIDDGRFVPHTEGVVNVVGVVYRGGYLFEGIMHTAITIDGLDATEKLADMINRSEYHGELRAVVLDGVTFAGFNVVDINNLFSIIDLPVIAVTRRKPNLDKIRCALNNIPDFEKRWQAILNAGELFEVETRSGINPVYVQLAGILPEDAEKIIRKTSAHSNIPEALRVAHIVASGLTR
jgi:endonuclease V-like protein UPF0215 family